MTVGRRMFRALVGEPIALAPDLAARYPALTEARWRAGGLPLRVGGWCLGRARVAGITIGGTIFLSDPSAASPALLLHEVAHVRQFRRLRGFAWRYVWQSLRRGYSHNRFELEADAFAAHELASRPAAGLVPFTAAAPGGVESPGAARRTAAR